MGPYTAHWQEHARRVRRGVFRILLLVVLGLPATVLLSFAVGTFTDEYPVWVQIPASLVWLVAFTVMAVRYSRVTCPRCARVYTQGKGLATCPQCGLTMLAEWD